MNVDGDLSDISAISYSDHYDVNNASFTFIQTKAGNAVDVQVQVFSADDDLDFTDDGPALLITSVQIIDTKGDSDPNNDENLTQDFIDAGLISGLGSDTLTIDDLLTGYEVFVTSNTDFNRMEIENISAGEQEDFALGGFSVGTSQTAEPIGMSFNLTVSDEDGDASSGTVDVTLLPEIPEVNGDVVV